jgi:hypothetical protein
MHRILISPDPTGYPANLKAGYQLAGAGWIQDIRPDIKKYRLSGRISGASLFIYALELYMERTNQTNTTYNFCLRGGRKKCIIFCIAQ